MPQFQVGHAKLGGRKVGTPNKAVVLERKRVQDEVKAAAIAAAPEIGEVVSKLHGKDLLSYWANWFHLAAIHYLKTDLHHGIQLAVHACNQAARVASYETPQLKAVLVHEDKDGALARAFELDVVDPHQHVITHHVRQDEEPSEDKDLAKKDEPGVSGG